MYMHFPGMMNIHGLQILMNFASPGGVGDTGEGLGEGSTGGWEVGCTGG